MGLASGSCPNRLWQESSSESRLDEERRAMLGAIRDELRGLGVEDEAVASRQKQAEMVSAARELAGLRAEVRRAERAREEEESRRRVALEEERAAMRAVIAAELRRAGLERAAAEAAEQQRVEVEIATLRAEVGDGHAIRQEMP
jgi:hypothetical protein